MNLACAYFILAWVVFFVPAKQTFYVTMVKGAVILERSGKGLKKGDEIYDSDKLKFSTRADFVAAINTKGERVRLSAENTQMSSAAPSSEFMTVLAAMIPGRKTAATRGHIHPTKLNNHEVAPFFAGSNGLKTPTQQSEPFLILGQGKYHIPRFPQNDKQYFFVEYQYNGQTIQKKLASDQRHLLMSKEALYTDSTAIDIELVGEHKLYFCNYTKQPRVFITAFQPVFVEEADLKEELKFLIEKLAVKKAKNIDLLIDDMLPYLHDNYGKPDAYNVKVWLEKELGFKVE
jgi:hypothetical protein